MKTIAADYRGYGLFVEQIAGVWQLRMCPNRVELLDCELPVVEGDDHDQVILKAKAAIDAMLDRLDVARRRRA